MSAEVYTIYTAYCNKCGWEGPTTDSRKDAAQQAEWHNEEGCNG